MTPAEIARLEEFMRDPMRRLASGELYKIATADGSGIIPFIPRPEQVRVIRALLDSKKGLLIPKARRLGMSTVLGVFAADCLLFRPGWHGSLVDKTQADAALKLNRIVKIALEHLPPFVAKYAKFTKSNDSQVSLDFAGTGDRGFYAGMNARGGSNDFLWVSEWGPIQFDDAKRSAEIRSGALPSARSGLVVVETTWKGGKGGDLWELLEPSLTGAADDWRVLFFPWWVDPRNVDELASHDADSNAYFAKIEPRLQREQITLSDGQRRWWAKERRAQGIFMARENPTFLDECWSAPTPGAIYAESIECARTEGRIDRMPVDGLNLVNTSWDLGAPENSVVWYWQLVGREIRFIDCDRGAMGTLTERVANMLARGYNYGKHYLPHDCEQTERSGTTFLTELARAGLPARSLCVVPRTVDIWIGINHALSMFPALAFRTPQCDEGLDSLGCYRTRPTNEGGISSNEPVHDWASHAADAFRVMAEAHHCGMIQFKHTTAEPREHWYREKRVRRGVKPIMVSANY